MAAEGFSSHQMAHALGLSVGGVKKIVKQLKIDVPADRTLGRTRKTFDSTRIVIGIVLTGEGFGTAAELIDFSALDRKQIPGWVQSLRKSARTVTAFARRLESELTAEPVEHTPNPDYS